MSTRATYTFVDNRGEYTVYKHFDGYLEGAAEFLGRALQYAWPLRYEADDLAAAFVRANKREGGDVRLTSGRAAHADTEYHYETYWNPEKAELWVDCYRRVEPFGEDNWDNFLCLPLADFTGARFEYADHGKGGRTLNVWTSAGQLLESVMV